MLCTIEVPHIKKPDIELTPISWTPTYWGFFMTKYDDRFKLAVVQQYLSGTAGYSQVAAVFNIRSPGSISQWERCYHSGGIDALIPRSRGKPNKMPPPQDTKPQLPPDGAERTRDELVAEVNHLRMEVAYLKKLQALVQSQQQQRATARKKRR